jgi:hypothetical protein
MGDLDCPVKPARHDLSTPNVRLRTQTWMKTATKRRDAQRFEISLFTHFQICLQTEWFVPSSEHPLVASSTHTKVHAFYPPSPLVAIRSLSSTEASSFTWPGNKNKSTGPSKFHHRFDGAQADPTSPISPNSKAQKAQRGNAMPVSPPITLRSRVLRW